MASRRSKRRRGRGAWWPQFDLPKLEQRHWDLLGLGMVAFAAFFSCIFYLGWAGGEVGEVLADGLRFVFGAVAYTIPVALLGAGALLIMRPDAAGDAPLQDRGALPGGRPHARLRRGLARPRPRRHAARRLPRRHLPGAPRRAVWRVAVLGLEQAVLGSRLAHPVRLPAGRGRAAADRRLDRGAPEPHTRGRRGYEQSRSPHRQHPEPSDRPAAVARGQADPRAGAARAARARGS